MTATTSIFADRELAHVLEDDPELLAIADAISQTQRVAPRKRMPPLRIVLIAATAALLLAAPTYALVHSAIDFTSQPPAESEIVAQFGYMNSGAPNGMSPDVSAAQARHVTDFNLADGSRLSLSVAPTNNGGFCEYWGALGGTCVSATDNRVTLGYIYRRVPQAAFAFGQVRSPDAAKVELRWQDGRVVRLPLTRISAPIDASFFFYSVSAPGDWPITAAALDSQGNVIATSPRSGQQSAG